VAGIDLSIGKVKVATLLLSLKKEQVVQALKQLSESEIEEITKEIAKIDKISSADQETVIEEFLNEAKNNNNFNTRGGIDYAKDILETVFGKEKAENILKDFEESFNMTPFDFIDKAEPENVMRFIINEQPQTIALILAYITPKKAGQILALLPDHVQPEIARRIAIMDQTSPSVIKQIESILATNISSVISQHALTSAGGVNALAEVINSVGKSTEKKILEYLEEVDPQLSIKVKDLMFVFEDILMLDDRDIQKILQDIDIKELPVALKTASEELKEKIFKNLSDRAVETLKEEMEFMGPIRIKEVEDMQRKIINIIRNLEESGDISIARSSAEGEEFV
jgi:flagellar motor switch protein FliG